MYKWMIIAFGVYDLGDPELTLLGGLTQHKDYVVALVIAYFTMPWVSSQFDN